MKMKIPYKVVGYPKSLGVDIDENAKDYLSLLEDDEYFEKKVKEIRAKFDIKIDTELNQNELNFDDLVLKKHTNDLVGSAKNINLKNKYIAIVSLVEEYNLMPIWEYFLYSFIHTGVMLVLLYDPVPILIETNKKLTDEIRGNNLLSRVFMYPNDYLHITIRSKIGITDLHRFINDNWSAIENNLNSELSVPRLFPKVDVPNLETYKYIGRLRSEKPKVPFKKIADLLSEKYHKTFRDDEVRAMYNPNYKNIILNLRKSNTAIK